MDVLSSVWILICWICSAEPQYVISPYVSVTWTAAENTCNVYGYLADSDTIVQSVDGNSLKNCIGGNQFWLGNSLYRTKYISYKGCYNVSHLFDSGSNHMEDMSLARCQIHCYDQAGFFLRGHECKCLYSGDSPDNYNPTSPSNCEFVCLHNNCEFYGRYEAASIYTTYNLSEDVSDPLGDVNCFYFECNGGGQWLQKSPCTLTSGATALCDNGNEKENVESWEDATYFCRQNESNLRENRDAGHSCGNKKKFWSNVRRYEVDIRSKDNPFESNGRVGCAFSNSYDLKINYSADYYDDKRHFLCITDNANLHDDFRCYIEFSSSSTPLDHQSGTETTSGMTSNATVIGVVVGLLCCAAVGLAVFMIFCIRRKRALAEHVQIKENKTYGQSIGYMRGKDLVFSQSTVTSVSSKQPKKDNGKSSNGSFHYDPAKPISDIVHIDSKHGRTLGSHYHSIVMQEASQYDVIVLEQEESNDGPYVTKVENDYDHLREHREKTSGQLPEDEYSKCTENDYDYSTQRSEVPQTALEDDDYSKCNASNTRSDEDYDHSVQRPETSRIDLDDHEYSKCNDVYTRAENNYDHKVQRSDASRIDLDDNEYSKCNAAYTRTENDYDYSVQKSETSGVDIGDDNGYSKCNAAYCRTENDYDHSVQRPETSRLDIDDDNGYSKCNAAYTRTENEYDHSVHRSETPRVDLVDDNGYSHTTALPDNDVYDRCIRT